MFSEKAYSIRPIFMLAALLFIVLFALLWVEANTVQPIAPVVQLSPPPGYYANGVSLRLATTAQRLDIVYTLDGAAPTAESDRYFRPITLASARGVNVVRARPVLPDGSLGAEVQASYFHIDTALPVLSLIVDPPDLHHPQTGIATNFAKKGRLWERPVHLTWLEVPPEGNPQLGFQVDAGVRVHGASSRANDKKSWRFYFRSEYGLGRLDYTLFSAVDGVLPVTNFDRLVAASGGQDYGRSGWTLLRTSLISELAHEIGLVSTRIRPIILTLNGESQGVYLLRERTDEVFFEQSYGVDSDGNVTESADWLSLQQFILENDLSLDENYAFIQSQINLDNFIDYNILLQWAGSTDWLATNIDLYQHDNQYYFYLWDVDWTFWLVRWGGPDHNMVNWMQTDSRPGVQEGAKLFLNLMQHPEFNARFFARFDQLLLDELSPENVLPKIDRLSAELAPDIQYEINRWHPQGNWQTHVDLMREFATQRGDRLREHLAVFR